MNRRLLSRLVEPSGNIYAVCSFSWICLYCFLCWSLPRVAIFWSEFAFLGFWCLNFSSIIGITLINLRNDLKYYSSPRSAWGYFYGLARFQQGMLCNQTYTVQQRSFFSLFCPFNSHPLLTIWGNKRHLFLFSPTLSHSISMSKLQGQLTKLQKCQTSRYSKSTIGVSFHPLIAGWTSQDFVFIYFPLTYSTCPVLLTHLLFRLHCPSIFFPLCISELNVPIINNVLCLLQLLTAEVKPKLILPTSLYS